MTVKLLERVNNIINTINEQTDDLHTWECDMVVLFLCELLKYLVHKDVYDAYERGGEIRKDTGEA